MRTCAREVTRCQFKSTEPQMRKFLPASDIVSPTFKPVKRKNISGTIHVSPLAKSTAACFALLLVNLKSAKGLFPPNAFSGFMPKIKTWPSELPPKFSIFSQVVLSKVNCEHSIGIKSRPKPAALFPFSI